MNSKIFMTGVAVLTLGVIAGVAIRHSVVSRSSSSGARAAFIAGKSYEGNVLKKAVRASVVPIPVKQAQKLAPAADAVISNGPSQSSKSLPLGASLAAGAQVPAGFSSGTSSAQGVNVSRQEAASNAPSPRDIASNPLPVFEPVMNGTGPIPKAQDNGSMEINNSQAIKAMAAPRAAQAARNRVGPAAPPRASMTQLPAFTPITNTAGPVASGDQKSAAAF